MRISLTNLLDDLSRFWYTKKEFDTCSYLHSTFIYSIFLQCIHSMMSQLLPFMLLCGYISICDWCKYIHLVLKVKQVLLIKHTSKFRKKNFSPRYSNFTTESFKCRSQTFFFTSINTSFASKKVIFSFIDLIFCFDTPSRYYWIYVVGLLINYLL